MESITFELDGEAPVRFYILEEVKIGGTQYILVTEEEKGDGDAFILKDISEPEEVEAVYEIVEDDMELDAVAAVFESILEDIELK